MGFLESIVFRSQSSYPDNSILINQRIFVSEVCSLILHLLRFLLFILSVCKSRRDRLLHIITHTIVPLQLVHHE